MNLNINKIFKDYMRDKQKVHLHEDASDDDMHADDWLYQQNNGTPKPFKVPQTTSITTSSPLPPTNSPPITSTNIDKSMLGGYDAAVKYADEHPGRSIHISSEKNPITGKYPVGVKIDSDVETPPARTPRPNVAPRPAAPQEYKNIQWNKYNDNSEFWNGAKKGWGGKISPENGAAVLPLKSNTPVDNASQLNRLWDKYSGMVQPQLQSAGMAASAPSEQKSEIGLPPEHLPGATQLQKEADKVKLPPRLDPPKTPSVLNQPQGQSAAQPQGQPQGQPAAQPQGQSVAQPQGQPQGQPAAQPQGQPQGQPAAQPQFDPSKYPQAQRIAEPTAGMKARTWLNTNIGRGVGDFAYKNPVMSGLMVGAPLAVLAAGMMNRNQNRR